MAKQQINIKLPPALIEALRERAATEEITLTDLIQGFCEQGLGLPRSNDSTADLEQVYDRILSEIDKRIPNKVDNCIASQLTTLQEQIEQRISERILGQVAPFQKHVIELTHDIPGRIAGYIATEREKIDRMIARSEARLELARREAIRSIGGGDVTPSMMPSESVPTPEVVAEPEPQPEPVKPPIVDPEPELPDVPEPPATVTEPDITIDDQVAAMLGDGLAQIESNTAPSKRTSRKLTTNNDEEPVTITKDSRLTQVQLARRFGHISSKTGLPDNSRISKKQRASDFQRWSWERDPQGIAWRFDPDAKLFYPVLDDGDLS